MYPFSDTAPCQALKNTLCLAKPILLFVEVPILPPNEILGLLPEPLQVRLVTDMEKGEALVDSRGTGSFYREGRG